MPIFISSSTGRINHKERKEHKEKAERLTENYKRACGWVICNLPAFDLPSSLDYQ
jgi:hypothetical protein